MLIFFTASSAYSRPARLRYPPNIAVWTEEVSHGEFIRTGYDQKLEYNPLQTSILIQGLLKRQHKGPYTKLPWYLGIIKKQPEPKAESGTQ